MNGRVYDPVIGRFLSVDPVFQFPENTQSLNPYTYVLNSPLSLTDPTGFTSDGTSSGEELQDGKSAGERAEGDIEGVTVYLTKDGKLVAEVSKSDGTTEYKSVQGAAGAKLIGKIAEINGSSPDTIGSLPTRGSDGASAGSTSTQPKTKAQQKVEKAIKGWLPKIQRALEKLKADSPIPSDWAPKDIMSMKYSVEDGYFCSNNVCQDRRTEKPTMATHDRGTRHVSFFAGAILRNVGTGKGLAEVVAHEFWHTTNENRITRIESVINGTFDENAYAKQPHELEAFEKAKYIRGHL